MNPVTFVPRILHPHIWLAPFLFLFALGSPAQELTDTITRADQANVLAEAEIRRIMKVHLEGTVCGVDRLHQSLALRDDSGLVWLEKIAFQEGLEPGSRITVDGMAALGNGHIILGGAPVVEQYWSRGRSEQSGMIYLKAGRQPINLHFFQDAGLRSLGLFYEGPGLTRTNVPASMLFCSDPNNAGQVVPGIHFECFEGSWPKMPEHGGPASYLSGITTNFAIDVSGRETNFTVHFSGFIDVPMEGSYQFTVAADDGAYLTLPYDTSNQVTVLGREALPQARVVAPGQLWDEKVETFWAEVEGLVRHIGRDGDHLLIELSSERAGRMRVIVSDGTSAALGILLDSRIRARGICRSTVTPGYNKLAGDLFVPSMNEVTITDASEPLWLLHPVTAVSNLLTLPLSNNSETIVHLEGTIAEIATNGAIVLEESSGRIPAHGGPAAAQYRTDRVEVIGQLVRENGQLALSSASWRPAATNTSGRKLLTLTTIEQVRRLKPAQAALQYPVQLRGVVTFVFFGGRRAHVQGDREGIYVSSTSASGSKQLHVGELCEFEGITTAGAFSPVLTYKTATVLGRGHFPEPMRPTRQQLLNGSLDAQWVEVEGLVLQAKGGDLTIGMRGGTIVAKFFHDNKSDLTNYVDAVVRVRGTVRAVANKQRQLQNLYIQVASPLQLTVDQPAPEDPFSALSKHVSELREFDPSAASFQRIKTSGQVLHVRNGNGYLIDGTNGMRFMLRENDNSLAAGDQVEVVGFPDIEGPAPALRQALIRRTGHSAPPEPQVVVENDLLSSANDSTRVRLDAVLLGIRTNQTEQVLELQIGQRFSQARLDHALGGFGEIPVGSSIQVVGTYVGQGFDASAPENVQSFELLLNSPTDVNILRRPSWWTVGRALVAIGSLGMVLAIALVWITVLRRQVAFRTRALRSEIESHKATELQLKDKSESLQQLNNELGDKKSRLENEIEERKRMELEVERVHRQLVDASRQAGQAEVASSVLHNVGNVLNSVNVSTTLIADRVRNMRVVNISKAANLMLSQRENIGQFFSDDPKGQQLPGYLEQLGAQLAKDQAELVEEVKELSENVDHIKEIVAMQQTYAKVAGLTETLDLVELVDSALKMQSGANQRHNIQVVREYQESPQVTVDKHKMLQILVNLMQNAKYACDEGGTNDKRIVVRISSVGEDRIKIEVIDNGIGIARENMTRIFNHGFTTRQHGHGFGLHSSALAAKQMGGSLTAHSDGPGHGAMFTLEVPRFHADQKSAADADRVEMV